jgi:ABC-type dipeptide/oligopeptide/nickel transport system permease component
METSLVEPLIERAEQFGKTTFELIKLKSLDKAADVTSSLISRLLLTVVLSVFIITLSIAIALWLGTLLGKNYYGFFIVASFYGIAGIILFFIHPAIKTRANNVIIKQMLN